MFTKIQHCKSTPNWSLFILCFLLVRVEFGLLQWCFNHRNKTTPNWHALQIAYASTPLLFVLIRKENICAKTNMVRKWLKLMILLFAFFQICPIFNKIKHFLNFSYLVPHSLDVLSIPTTTKLHTNYEPITSLLKNDILITEMYIPYGIL